MSDDRIFAELAAMRGELSELRAMRGELSELGAMRAELSELSAMRAELTALKAGHAAILAELDRTRGDVMARIDRLADQVNALREDAVVAFGAAEQVRRNNDRIRDELHAWQDIVGAMQKRLMALDARVGALEGKT